MTVIMRTLQLFIKKNSYGCYKYAQDLTLNNKHHGDVAVIHKKPLKNMGVTNIHMSLHARHHGDYSRVE